jgi:hypothetical protein
MRDHRANSCNIRVKKRVSPEYPDSMVTAVDPIAALHSCMIEFNEMLSRRLSKVLRFTGKAVAS